MVGSALLLLLVSEKNVIITIKITFFCGWLKMVAHLHWQLALYLLCFFDSCSNINFQSSNKDRQNAAYVA